MAFAAALTEKRGPRVGDAASLWNFTPAPGWTREEVQILRLCLMKHGVGQWMQILNTGLLPGKLIQQLNGQTQRLLGQQSLAAFTGLRVDVDRIRIENETRADATRKAGLIIYDGPLLTKEMKAELREEAQRKYGLAPEQMQKVDEQLEEAAAAHRSAAADAAGGHGAAAGASGLGVAADCEQLVARLDPELSGLLGLPLEQLSAEQVIQLLKRLRNRLACLVDRHRSRLAQPPRAGPRWDGEAEAAELLAAVAEASSAQACEAEVAAAGPAGSSAAPSEAGAAQPGPGVSRNLLAEATACRVRSGTSAMPPRAPVSAHQAGVARKRSKPGKPKAGAASSGSGLQPDGQDWSAGEENTGPSSSRQQGAGSKRRAGGLPDGGAADGAASRRGTRKRPATRYDKYVDDAEYEDADPSAGHEEVSDPVEALSTLTAMGFTPRKARGALRECDFNVEAAVEWLFANCV